MSGPEHKKDIDPVTGVETMGHEWDGIKELNNPAPRWWLWVFYVCCIFSFGYWIVYPAWPTLNGNTAGIWGWTSYNKLVNEQAEIKTIQAAHTAKLEKAGFAQIQNDPDLYAFAVEGGRAAFRDNCATCHGSGAAGNIGYPNLNDDDWLWGGSIEAIEQTILYGIRSGHANARDSQMPAFGKDGVLESADVDAVTDYVLTLSGAEHKATYEKGATVFAENCAACHGDEGKGGRDFGAPNLTDKIWLYGGDRAQVYQTVFSAHAGVMPTWEARLDRNTIRELAVYVHSLGGGEPSESVTAPAPVE